MVRRTVLVWLLLPVLTIAAQPTGKDAGPASHADASLNDRPQEIELPETLTQTTAKPDAPTPQSPDPQSPDPQLDWQPLRVWIEWSRPTPTSRFAAEADSTEDGATWQGHLTLRDAKIVRWQPLVHQGDEALHIRRQHEGWRIEPIGGRVAGGIEVELLAGDDAKLISTLQCSTHRNPRIPTATRPATTTSIDLVALPPQPSFNLPGGGRLQVQVRREPLRLQHDHRHFVFAPRQPFRLSVLPAIDSEFRCKQMFVTMRFLRREDAGDGARAESLKIRTIPYAPTTSGPARFPIDFRLPDRPGSYTLHLDLWGAKDPEKIRRTLLAERSIDLLIVDRHAAQPQTQTPTPSEPASPIEWTDRQTFDVDVLRLQTTPRDFASPPDDAADGNWETPGTARRLELSNLTPGHLHKLVWKGTSPLAETLRVTITHPGRDRPLEQASFPPGGFAPSANTRELWFWPREREAIVVVENPDLLEGASQAQLQLARAVRTANPANPASATRPYVPLIGSPAALRRGSKHDLASSPYESLTEIAKALTRRMRLLNVSTVMLTVADQQGSWYPSRFVPRHDPWSDRRRQDEAFATPTPDVLETLLCFADAQGIRVVPTIDWQFATKTLAATGDMPPYDLADPHVREAVIEVVREINLNYRKHRSFAGVAIHCPAGSWWQATSATRQRQAFWRQIGRQVFSTKSTQQLNVRLADGTRKPLTAPHRVDRGNRLFVFDGPDTATLDQVRFAVASSHDEVDQVVFLQRTTTPADLETRPSGARRTNARPRTHDHAGSLMQHLAAADQHWIIEAMPGFSIADGTAMRERIGAWQQLPGQPLDARDLSSPSASLQPDATVTLRLETVAGRCRGYLINHSPWSAVALIRWPQATSDTAPETFTRTGWQAAEKVDADMYAISLRPHSLGALRAPVAAGTPTALATIRTPNDLQKIEDALTKLQAAATAPRHAGPRLSTEMTKPAATESIDRIDAAKAALALQNLAPAWRILHDPPSQAKTPRAAAAPARLARHKPSSAEAKVIEAPVQRVENPGQVKASDPQTAPAHDTPAEVTDTVKQAPQPTLKAPGNQTVDEPGQPDELKGLGVDVPDARTRDEQAITPEPAANPQASESPRGPAKRDLPPASIRNLFGREMFGGSGLAPQLHFGLPLKLSTDD